jgi:hypothetical protein
VELFNLSEESILIVILAAQACPILPFARLAIVGKISLA